MDQKKEYKIPIAVSLTNPFYKRNRTKNSPNNGGTPDGSFESGPKEGAEITLSGEGAARASSKVKLTVDE